MTDEKTSAPTGAAPPREVDFLRRLSATPELGPAILLIVMLVVFTAINPAFISLNNISNALTFTVELGLIALGMTLLMTSGEFDLSVGSVFGFTAVVMWTLINSTALGMPLAFLIAMSVALAIGAINGFFVTRLKIPSFLVTLGMLLVVRGSALWLTSGFPQRTWDAGEQWLAEWLVGDFCIGGAGDFCTGGLRVYMSLIWFVLIAALLHYVLTRTRFGNWIQATGGNPAAARNRGVPIRRVKMLLFMLTSALAGLTGIISSIRVSAANPNSGTTYELEVIAMVVIGGTALMGGRGTILGTVLGVLILRLMRNGIVLIGVPGLAYNIFIGAIILGMMALHSALERRHNEGT
ncbi:MAG: ABC transporter permease [Paracoccaceae bacterium]|nr:ABC transporter permease [Paracoccaceae bacterium]